MRERLFKVVGLLLLGGSLFVGWHLLRYQAFVGLPLNVGEGVTLIVEPGSSLSAVAYELENRGIVEDGRLFVWMGRHKGGAGAIKAGEYQIAKGTTPSQLYEQMISGRVVQYGITLVEGWTFKQLMRLLKENPVLQHNLTGLSDEQIMQRLGHPGEHPEGRFFPDTYYFSRGMSELEILQRSYRAMTERLEREWQGRSEGLPFKNAYEALILASIVEKETALPEERQTIAGVFVRRLQKGMKLQTDPTVIYGLGSSFDGNLTRRDLNRDMPYNTYRNVGLPPTPIAMPGGNALHAALHPSTGEALYFVAKGDGSHHFSATLEEHNQAVARYQLTGH